MWEEFPNFFGKHVKEETKQKVKQVHKEVH